MTPTECVRLVRLVKAIAPAQTFDEMTPDMWHPLLEDVEAAAEAHEAAADRLPAWKEGQEWRTSASALREYLSSDPDPSGRYVRNGGQEKQ